MIVLTTPTGDVGGQLLSALVASGNSLRVIVRDPAKLSDDVRERVQVVVGSHADPAVLDEALKGADALFFLVPPSMRANSAQDHYLSFAQPAAEAIARRGVGHVVGISSAGWDWPGEAGLLSAAHAMDKVLEGSGAAYRSLGMGFYMENLRRPLAAMIDHGALALPLAGDRPLALIATRDVAARATDLLSDLSWEGTVHIPVFSPDHLTPREMAATVSDVLGTPVVFEPEDLEQTRTATVARGVSEEMARDFTQMYQAQQDGIYDEDWTHATPSPTTFRQWCEAVLAPAAQRLVP